jgi:hypothetical protein
MLQWGIRPLRVRPAGIEPATLAGSDFKSDVFANFTTGARGAG